MQNGSAGGIRDSGDLGEVGWVAVVRTLMD